MAIIVYNNTREDHSNHPNNFYIGRPSILGNPYTDKPLNSTLAIYKVKTREEAIERYDSYFDIQYKFNSEFRKVIDEIYGLYKNGEDVYLECFCKKYPSTDKSYHDDEVSCHGDIIAQKLQKRLLKEKIEIIKEERNA